MSEEILGAEELEVTEPVDEGAEEQEVTEPVVDEANTKTEQDRAFAEMRRAKEAAEKLASERQAALDAMEAENAAQKSAYERLGLGEDGQIDAIADSLGVEKDDIKATIEAEREMALKDIELKKKDAELEFYRKQAEEEKFAREAQADLATIQKLDPKIKSLEDLGEEFLIYSQAGLDAESAYWAVKSKEEKTKIIPPAEIGKFQSEPPKKEFYTREEVMNMTEDEQRKHSKEIVASSAKW